VRDATNDPIHPARGADVTMRVRVVSDAGTPTSVVLTYCRVQNYACAAPVNMTPAPGGEYSAIVPWRDTFFRSVRDVGYSFIIRFADGSSEHSPIANWPATPSDLPKVDATYYFYSLPEEAHRTPTPWWIAAAAIVCASLVRARRRDA